MALVLMPARRRYPPPRLLARGLRGFRGLGDCSSPISSYGGVPYCRDNVTGSLVPCSDPACGAPAGGGVVSGSPTFVPMGSPNYATMPFGNSTTTTFTLASYMAEQVQFFTGQSPASLQNQGITPSTAAAQLMALAQQYCAVEGPPDCGQIGSIVSAAAAQVAAAFAGIPASQWNPATYTPYAISAGGGAPSSGGGPGGGSAPQVGVVTNPGPAIPPSVVMKNLTRPGSDTQYQVGDSWQISITGTPGAAVSGSASQGGQNLGTTAFGNLNQSGQMVLTGTMTAGQVGTWVEGWTIAGNAPSITLSFSVVAPAGASAGGAGTSTASGVPAGSAAGAASGFTLPDLSGIPTWAYYAAGGLVLFMMLKK